MFFLFEFLRFIEFLYVFLIDIFVIRSPGSLFDWPSLIKKIINLV